MKKFALVLLCLLTSTSYGRLCVNEEPIGRRLGMSLIEVIDSIHKEGVYQYSYSEVDKRPAGPVIGVVFENTANTKFLTYIFDRDKCVRANLLLPVEELRTTVAIYNILYTKTGSQQWQSQYGRIGLSVASGEESNLLDHKPHLSIDFEPLN